MSRVLLASVDAVFGEVLRNAFKSEGDLDLCAETRNGVEAVDKAMELLPDLVILDMPHARDFEIARALKMSRPETPVFLITDQHGMQSEKVALSHGIDAVFTKDRDFTSLLLNARAVCGLE